MSVISELADRLEAILVRHRVSTPFRRSSEVLADARVPAKGCLRRFNVDVLGGQDDSMEGGGALGAGDLRARLKIAVAYPRGREEPAMEQFLSSDAELAMRALARAAAWSGTSIRRSTCRWAMRKTTDKLFLDLTLEVQYRDPQPPQ